MLPGLNFIWVKWKCIIDDKHNKNTLSLTGVYLFDVIAIYSVHSTLKLAPVRQPPDTCMQDTVKHLRIYTDITVILPEMSNAETFCKLTSTLQSTNIDVFNLISRLITVIGNELSV